jgi:predicted ribosome quality control (RQC) complex YloA/Tae2 family protein
MDFRLAGGRQMLVSLDRTSPAIYLSSKGASSTDRARASSFFLSLLRKHLAESRLVKLWKEPSDRVVTLEFERLDAGGDKVRTSLRLALTGRSANAYLVDAQDSVTGKLFDQGLAEPIAPVGSSIDNLEPQNLPTDLPDSIGQSEVLDRFFGPGSVFSPQLKNEFLARCHGKPPSAAFNSLAEDLFNREPLPLLYSRLPLDDLEHQVINPKTDLLLSHIELVQAGQMQCYQFSSLSEAAERYYLARTQAISLCGEYAALRQTITREINKRESALSAIESDRARFEHPEELKRCGDLLLANLANARIDRSRATLVDYYDPDQPEIQIDLPDGATLKEAAADYFARYRKARRAQEAIASRQREVSRTLVPLKTFLLELDTESTSQRIAHMRAETDQLLGRSAARRDSSKRARVKSGSDLGRRFRSSDGYEIAVGRNDRDNDALTFRVARPLDVWLHAADYPGSHVIIRNPTREPVPHRTIAEAAELAAFYSQAKREGKAAVHYTQKKFVSKPPRSKPGLVRLSSFKTILVEPRCNIERLG